MKTDLLARFPLLSLRHLEAAVRLGTFERAASELNVTPSAVSQQIKRIEAGLGRPLFDRTANRVVPNARALDLGRTLTEAFALIGTGLDLALSDAAAQSVKIRLYQTWANRWLVPRLERFTRRFPDIAVEFETGREAVDFARTDADLALSSEVQPSRLVRTRPVLIPRLAPVCTPALAERLRHPADLAQVARIASRNRMMDWPLWLEAEGQAQVDQRPLLVFSNSTMVYESALSGAGVAIAQVELVLGDLETGRLVRPFPRTIRSDTPILLLEHEARVRRPGVARFRSWMIEEIDALVARADACIGQGAVT